MNEPIVFPQSFIDAMSERIRRHIEWRIAYGDLYGFGAPIRNRGLPSVSTGTRWGLAMDSEQFAANFIGSRWWKG